MQTATILHLEDRPPDFRVPPLPRFQAHRIASDAEAIEAARQAARVIAPGATERDRARRLPHPEMDILSQAGLLAITVPKEYGGAGVRSGTLAEVIAILAAADGSIGQIPQNHYFLLEGLRLAGTEAQKRFFFARALAGERFGNALSERTTRTAQDHATRILQDGSGYRVNGQKFYSTGVLFAHWIGVVGNDRDGRSLIAFIPRDTAGVTIADDWSGFGQRTTGSGTTTFADVEVHPFSIVSMSRLFEQPTTMGPNAQIMHAAIDQGIARGAYEKTLHFVRHFARPWKESGVDHGYEDPHVIADIGGLKIRLDAGDALIERAGRFVDAARQNPTEETVAEASIAVAEAKVLANDNALLAGSKLVELGGSRAALAEHGFDRYWRDARVHTVHDPVRWKYRVIGNYWLNGVRPPRHGAL
ncbi:MAG TPA: SfnB family sulfur acquisition oxidoreductase [Bauldia sp.]|nr:SfnB family sulfur acquisition oxidoreductase [Bauldia sp.]